MQDMTFDANENNFDSSYENDDGTIEYRFNGCIGPCVEGNDFNFSGYTYQYYFKHFILDDLGEKYENGIDKIFFKFNEQGFLTFIYLDLNDESKVYTFDVNLKYDEQEDIYKLTLRDIYISIDFQCRYLKLEDESICIKKIIEEPDRDNCSHVALGNFRLVTERLNLD